MKFRTRVRLKPSNDRGEFELDRARSKTNIAENLFALGHEMHNSHFYEYFRPQATLMTIVINQQ